MSQKNLTRKETFDSIHNMWKYIDIEVLSGHASYASRLYQNGYEATNPIKNENYAEGDPVHVPGRLDKVTCSTGFCNREVSSYVHLPKQYHLKIEELKTADSIQYPIIQDWLQNARHQANDDRAQREEIFTSECKQDSNNRLNRMGRGLYLSPPKCL